MHLSPLSFAFTFILYSVALLSSAVPFDDESGVLYRFSPVSENEIEELLSWAGVRRLLMIALCKSSSLFIFYSCVNGTCGKRAILTSTSTSPVVLSLRPSSVMYPSIYPRGLATASTDGTMMRPRTHMPTRHHRQHQRRPSPWPPRTTLAR